MSPNLYTLFVLVWSSLWKQTHGNSINPILCWAGLFPSYTDEQRNSQHQCTTSKMNDQ